MKLQSDNSLPQPETCAKSSSPGLVRRWSLGAFLPAKRRPSHRRKSGMTLVEVLVASGVGSMLLATVMSVFTFSHRSMASLLNYTELERQSQHALDVISRDIRQVTRLASYDTTSLTFIDNNGQQFGYVYNPETKTLRRIKGDRAEVLLRGCDEINFNIMQRNTQQSTFDQFPAGSVDTCKLLQLYWSCSRHLLGNLVNTESMQSAKIAIRTK